MRACPLIQSMNVLDSAHNFFDTGGGDHRSNETLFSLLTVANAQKNVLPLSSHREISRRLNVCFLLSEKQTLWASADCMNT